MKPKYKNIREPLDRSPESRPRVKGRSRWVILALAMLSLSLEGCQSGILSPCCGLRQRVTSGFQNLGSTVFGRRGGSTCCGGSEVGGEVYEGVQVMPGAVVAPGSIVPAPASPAGEMEGPTRLEAIPEKTGTKPGAASNRTGSNLGRNANAYRSTDAVGRGQAGGRLGTGQTLARNLQSTVGVDAAISKSGATDSASSVDPLDNLPPVEASRLLPEAPPVNSALAKPAPKLNTPVTETSATLSQGITVQPPAEATVRGIDRFGSVAPNISGGSLPTATGLDWLKEKGYKTVVDLREKRETDPSFVEEVNRRGLRYVSLPVDANRLDAELFRKFQEEISRAESRPIYFFDNNGHRAGMLWIVRRISSEGIDAGSASREAEELGLNDIALRQVAIAFAQTTRAPNPTAAPAPTALPRTSPAGAEKVATPASSPPVVPLVDLPKPTEPAAPAPAPKSSSK